MVKKLFFVLIAFVSLVSCVAAETQIAYEGFENSWNGGTGWTSGWYHQGDSNIVTTNSPYAGNNHLLMKRRTSYVDRQTDLSGFDQVTLRLYAKVNSFESNDFANLMVSSDGINWHILKTFVPSDSDNTYHLYEFDVTQYGLTNTVWIAVDGEMSNAEDYLYFDEISFVSNDTIEPPQPPVIPSWHIQFNPTPTNPPADVQYWNLDLFDVPNTTMLHLQSQGVFVMCYFSAGSWENWRADAAQFPQQCLGNSNGWPGERWLDTRCGAVRQIMAQRIELGIAKGCDGFDPDNMDAYGNGNTGFPLTEQDAIDYYTFLANYTHSRGKQIGLKNALNIIPEVLDNLDWEINEQCYQYHECNLLQPVLNAGKPVFHIEYPHGGQTHQQLAAQICNQSNQMGLATLIKNQQLDAFEISCLTYGNQTPQNETPFTVAAYDRFENNWNGGAGWMSEWYHEGDASIVSNAQPYAGAKHLRLRKSNGYVDRMVNLSGATAAILNVSAKVKNFAGTDSADLLISSNGRNWTVLRSFTSADADNTYHTYAFNISSYISPTVWIAIDGEMSSTEDHLYIDEVNITRPF